MDTLHHDREKVREENVKKRVWREERKRTEKIEINGGERERRKFGQKQRGKTRKESERGLDSRNSAKRKDP